MFGSFGWMELLLILIIVLIIFGAGKLPQLGEGIGKAIKGFKKTVHEPEAIDVTPSTGPAEQASAQGQPPQAAPPQVGQSAQAQPPAGQPQGQPQQSKEVRG